MKIFFDPLAYAELEDAVEWYEHEKSGLGKKFRDEIDESILSSSGLSNLDDT